PYRFVAFMDLRDASLFDLEGITNTLEVVPAPGVSAEQAQQELFGTPGVASVQPVPAYAQTIRDAVNEDIGILDIVRDAVLPPAALTAVASSSISACGRAREHATMLASGLPVRSTRWMAVEESFVIGALGAPVGLGVGLGPLGWISHGLLATTMPDIG